MASLIAGLNAGRHKQPQFFTLPRVAPFRLLSLLGLLGLLLCSSAQARIKLGEPLPAHLWPTSGQAAQPSFKQIPTTSAPFTPAEQAAFMQAQRALLVIYSHDCANAEAWWPSLLSSGWPLLAIDVGEQPTPAPKGVLVWRGAQAQAFARQLRPAAYPSVVVIEQGRVLYAWEGDYTGSLQLVRP